LRGNKMKTLTMVRLLLAATLVALLAACGGGGGDTTPTTTGGSGGGGTTTVGTTTVYNFTCWNGNITSTMSLTKDNCPAANPKPSLVVTSGKDVTITFASGTTPISGTLTATVQGGTETVRLVLTPAGSVSVTGTTKYATTYTWVSDVVYANAPNQNASGTFTTGQNPVVCTPPAMRNMANVCISPPTGYMATWNSNIGAWVANLNSTLTAAQVNMLPAGCMNTTDTCWNDSIANGTIVIMQGYLPDQAWAVFKFDASGTVRYNTVPISTLDGSSRASTALISGALSIQTTNYLNSSNGMVQKFPDGVCTLFLLGTGAYYTQPATCPF
jgi:hypothetical protein